MITVNLKKLAEMFPVGSLVRYKRDLDKNIILPDNYLDSKFRVEGHIGWFGKVDMVLSRLITEDEYSDAEYSEYWWHFELIPPENNQTNNSTICPKCGKEMIKKQTEFYGLIDKCLNCGYC